MAAIIENINFDKDFSKNFFKFIKEFLNQPKWLLIMLIVSVIFAIGYFGYNYYNEKIDITDLQEQVDEINVEIQQNISTIEFKKNINYLITGLTLLEQQENQNYMDELIEIDLIVIVLEKYHHDEPILCDLKAMKNRLIINHTLYQQNYDFYMNKLQKIVNDTIR